MTGALSIEPKFPVSNSGNFPCRKETKGFSQVGAKILQSHW